MLEFCEISLMWHFNVKGIVKLSSNFEREKELVTLVKPYQIEAKMPRKTIQEK